jgi:hypothetical protein
MNRRLRRRQSLPLLHQLRSADRGFPVDIQPILLAHAGLCICAGGMLALHRTRHLALTLLAFAAIDAVSIVDRAHWQVENALAFAMPICTLGAVAFTVGAPVKWAHFMTVPLVVIAASAVARGVQLGAVGLSWLLAIAHAYVAVVGLVLMRVGARQLPRFTAGIAGLFIATSAPAIVGWTMLARGRSVRAASVIDCVFLAAIVVLSFVEWTRRWQTSYSPRSQAPCSLR